MAERRLRQQDSLIVEGGLTPVLRERRESCTAYSWEYTHSKPTCFERSE